MGDHPTIRVGELLREDRGISVGVMYPGGDTPGGIPLLRAGDVQDGAINPHPSYRISKEVHHEYRRTALEGGECLITLVGKPGQTVVVPTHMAGWNAARALAVVRLKEPEDTEYFALAMSSPTVQGTILNWCNTTVQPTLNLKEIKELPIPWPKKPTRDAIAHTIGPLNRKVELNGRMNETLESMARAIFKDWFVDFGPSRAKANGREPYLAHDIWSLFPDALDDEDKPVGWEKQQARDLFEFNPRENIRKGTITPYLDMAALPTTGLVSEAPIHREYKSGSKFKDGDTLFARITPCLENGKTAYVFDLGEGVVGAGSTEFIVIRSKEPVPVPISYLLARDPKFRRHAEQSMTGTSGRQRANAEALMKYELASPSDDSVWRALGQLLEPMIARIIANAHESRTLAQTRDLLLPKLMSGEIRIKDVEKVVEDVA